MFQPLGNTTVLPPTKWHPEPQFRGTFGILSSCLITMSLCIWTSLHLNLPEHKKEHLQKYRQLGWMVLGLLAPEFVVWNAWVQRNEAKEVSALMQEKGFMPKQLKIWIRIREWFAKAWQITQVYFLLKAEEWPKLGNPTLSYHHIGRRHAWTDVHSWLVVMGGMCFHEDALLEDERLMLEGQSRIPLTPKVFKLIVENRPHLIPDISREYIEDKNKSDRLAKILTCWQAGYFCIQCIFRLSQRLTITLLELNVFAHAICALSLFLVWWDKPRDIREPTLLVNEEALDIYVCLAQLDAERSGLVLEAVHHSPPPLDKCFELGCPKSFTARFHPCAPQSYSRLPDESLRYLDITAASIRYEYLKVHDTYWRIRVDQFRGKYIGDQGIAVKFIGRSIRRLMRRYRLIRETSTLHSLLMSLERHPQLSVRQGRISNWALVDDNIFAGHFAGLFFGPYCYGILHTVAGPSIFPSQIEALMWRAASATIYATGPCFWIIMYFIGHMCELSKPQATAKVLVKFLRSLLSRIILYLFSLLSLWYIFCRAFIVVESFIMLAPIPDTALHVPTWAAYIPSFK
jgi:hypothetical protein